jgi:CRP-like cAMP-binding protein
MNYVAGWARELGLMEFTGDECVPKSASLLEAHMSKQPARLARLQRRDGYAGTIDVRHEGPLVSDVDRGAILESLQRVELLSALSLDELQQLADVVRPIHLGHLERIIVQGREGSSLFILQDGTLEVITRVDSSERQVAVLQPPAVVGELAFLLGEKRSATVRAIEQATVLELGAAQLRPIVESRPPVLDGLVALLEERRRRNLEPPVSGRLFDRVRRAIFTASAG